MSENNDYEIEKPDDLDDELMEDFLTEAQDNIVVVKKLFIEMDISKDKTLIEKMFTPMHSIKGGANYLGLQNTGTLALSLEKLLHKVKKNELKIDDMLIVIVNDGITHLEKLIDEIEASGWEQSSSHEIVEAINYIMENGPTSEDSSSEQDESGVSGPPEHLDEELLEDFKEESAEQLDIIEASLLKLEKNPDNKKLVHTIFGAMHSIKGGANYLGLQSTGNLAHSLENLLAKINKEEQEVTSAIIDVLLKGSDFIKQLLKEIVNDGWEKSNSKSLVEKVNALAGGASPDAPAQASVAQPTENSYENLIVKYNSVTQIVNEYLESLNQGREDDETTVAMGNFFDEIYQESSMYGLIRIAEVSEVIKKVFVGLKEEKIRNIPFAIQAVYEGINFLGMLFEDIKATKKENTDILPVISIFSQVEFTESAGGDPITEFISETKAHLIEIDKNLKIIVSKGYRLSIYEDITYTLTIIKGAANTLGFQSLAMLLGNMEKLSNMLQVGDLEFFPRVQYIFRNAIGAINKALDCIASQKSCDEVIAEITKEIEQLIKNRKAFYDKKLENDVIERVKNFVLDLETSVLQLKKGTATIANFKDISESFEQYLIDKEVEYYWTCSQFLLEAACDMEGKELETDDINLLYGTIQELKELTVLGKASALDPNIDKENMSIEERIRYIPGMTEKLAEKFLQEYNAVESLENATIEGLIQVDGINPVIAERILNEFSTTIQLLPEEKELNSEIDKIIQDRNTLKDNDYDNELIDIFVKNAKDILYKLSKMLFSRDRFSATDFISQIKKLIMRLNDSANYMNYKVILNTCYDILAQVEDIEEKGSEISEKEIIYIRSKLLEIAGLLPLSQKDIKHLDITPEPAAPVVEPIAPPVLEEAKTIEPIETEFSHQDEVAKIFVLNIYDDIEVITQITESLSPGQSNLEPLKTICDLFKNMEMSAVKNNFQDFSLILLQQINYLEGVIHKGNLTADNIFNLQETIKNCVDYLRQLEGKSLEPELPSGYFDDDSQFNIQTETEVEPEPAAEPEKKKVITERDITPQVIFDDKDDTSEEGLTTNTLRVNSRKVDELMNLVGELVVNRSSFDLFHQKLEEMYRELNASNALSREYQEVFESLISKINISSSELGRVTNELQENVMQVRMVPVEILFRRFPRIVRDLSKKMGKMIKLEINGKSTELDKIVMEKITNPMVHIFRNMVDHGIETPEERKKMKKPPYGTVEIYAYHEGNQVVIEIADDGRGIDTEKVRQKCLDLGILEPNAAKRMKKYELLNMLYHPGFTMAEKVSMTSGRGMGMNIIKAKIAEIGGTIDIDTEIGHYTCFTIKIPLTLAIIQALLVKIYGNTYSIPTSSVREVVKIKKSDIYTLEGQEVICIRENIIPVLNPRTIFNLPNEPEEMGYMVIVHTGHRNSGLLVQQVRSTRDIVIKSVGDDLLITRGVSGATIMGDGSVSLILDIPALVELAYDQETQTA